MRFVTARALLFSLCLLVSGLILAQGDTPVNVNTASAEALAEALTGVGVTRAEAIVEFRDANGPYQSVDDLLEVAGIGQGTVEANRARITLE